MGQYPVWFAGLLDGMGDRLPTPVEWELIVTKAELSLMEPVLTSSRSPFETWITAVKDMVAGPSPSPREWAIIKQRHSEILAEMAANKMLRTHHDERASAQFAAQQHPVLTVAKGR